MHTPGGAASRSRSDIYEFPGCRRSTRCFRPPEFASTGLGQNIQQTPASRSSNEASSEHSAEEETDKKNRDELPGLERTIEEVKVLEISAKFHPDPVSCEVLLLSAMATTGFPRTHLALGTLGPSGLSSFVANAITRFKAENLYFLRLGVDDFSTGQGEDEESTPSGGFSAQDLNFLSLEADDFGPGQKEDEEPTPPGGTLLKMIASTQRLEHLELSGQKLKSSRAFLSTMFMAGDTAISAKLERLSIGGQGGWEIPREELFTVVSKRSDVLERLEIVRFQNQHHESLHHLDLRVWNMIKGGPEKRNVYVRMWQSGIHFKLDVYRKGWYTTSNVGLACSFRGKETKCCWNGPDCAFLAQAEADGQRL